MPQVLIIDDEPHILNLLELKFQLEGYEVLAAASGAEGLQAAVSCQPDLIILDGTLATVEGVSVGEQLRALPATASTPLILLGAPPCDGVGEGVAEPVTHVRKPFRPSQLLAMARKIFEVRRAGSSW